METIAVYWEPVIKTYGFIEKTGLSLFSFFCPVERMVAWGHRLQQWGNEGDGFILIAGLGRNDRLLQLQLVLEPNGVDRYGEILEKWRQADPQMALEVESPVELIYFHGPHYGDRYGIAHAVLNALALQSVPVRTMACTGASVYLIVPEGKAGPAREGLNRAFKTPEPGV